MKHQTFEPRRGVLSIAAPADVHPPNPVGVACLSHRLRRNVIIGSAAPRTGHPYGVKKDVIVWVGEATNRPPLRGLQLLDCGSPLPLFPLTREKPKRQRTAAVQKLRHVGIGTLLLLTVAAAAYAQGPGAPTPARDQVVTRVGTNLVSIIITGGERVIRANGLPDHIPGQFPRRGNPNTIAPQHYNFRVPTDPHVASQPASSARWWFGVALNGVPFEPGTAEFWNNDPRSGLNYEAKGGFIDLGLDEHNAHVQPTGAYHYHGLPTGLMARLGGDGKKMLLVGWAADGFPIYTAYGHTDPKDAKSPLRKLRTGYRIKAGQRAGGPAGNYDGRFTADYEYVKGAGDLDECNGRFGVTPEFPRGIYHYYLTEEFPYISRLFRGTPDQSFRKGGMGRGPRGPGFGPRPPP